MNVLLKKILFIAVILVPLGFLAYFSLYKYTAPEVTFITTDGDKIAMKDLKGKLVLVNFWATDCLPCVTEMPALGETYKQYKKDGLEIIAVAMPYDPPAQVLNYVRIKKPPFPVMVDGLSEITNKFENVEVTPTTFIYNKQGKLIQRTIGALDFIKLHQLLNAELSAKN